eukprot:9496060-Pyramimonas_sp.AAC.1
METTVPFSRSSGSSGYYSRMLCYGLWSELLLCSERLPESEWFFTCATGFRLYATSTSDAAFR